MVYTLTIIDVSGIQNYLFGSNRLIHNIGASYLVKQATGDWIDEIIKPMRQGGAIESGGVDVEIVYCGGGNAVLLFATADLARQFTRQYTRTLLKRAPGLRAVVQHTDFEWGEVLSTVYTQAIKKLAQKKADQTPLSPLLGLSVTAACQYTGLPAVDRDPTDKDQDGKGKYVSAETNAKIAVRDEARKEFEKDFKNLLKGREFVRDFNDFGGHDEAGYLAVVHADGNGMGKRKDELCQKYSLASDNRRFIDELGNFSKQVNKAGMEALRATLKFAIDWSELNKEDGKGFLKPDKVMFVPLVFGGDDVTFVCDDKFGLSLAAIYLREFHQYEVGGKLLHACAGVTVVKNRYPFAQAYNMAEELCKQAKTAVRELERDASALDWHFAVNGAVLPVNQIRPREYTVQKPGDLTIRPLFVAGEKTPALQSWPAFCHTVSEFTQGKAWKEHHTKVKTLRETLRQGGQATQLFRELLGLPKFPKIEDVLDCQETGWHGNKCAYFDAIEVMDRFIDIQSSVSR